MIPYVVGGKSKILTMHPYNGVCLAMPGRHSKQTDPVGGDFVVLLDDEKKDWVRHPFTHADIFDDLQEKARAFPGTTGVFMGDYLDVINGADPEKKDWSETELPGVHPQTLLYGLQCLAVAEHRRFHMHEARFGGRFLPFRASAGIAEGLWTATEAYEKTRRLGRPGVEWLEKDHGVPTLTKELMQ